MPRSGRGQCPPRYSRLAPVDNTNDPKHDRIFIVESPTRTCTCSTSQSDHHIFAYDSHGRNACNHQPCIFVHDHAATIGGATPPPPATAGSSPTRISCHIAPKSLPCRIAASLATSPAPEYPPPSATLKVLPSVLAAPCVLLCG